MENGDWYQPHLQGQRLFDENILTCSGNQILVTAKALFISEHSVPPAF